MTRDSKPIPVIAVAFLETHKTHNDEQITRLFHRWLERNDLTLDALTLSQMNAFLQCPTGRSISKKTRNEYRCGLWRYLAWLHDRNLIHVDPEPLAPSRCKPLPKQAARYVDQLRPVRRSSTISRYEWMLRKFHHWLDENHIRLATLERRDTIRWFQWLHESGLNPATRVMILIVARAYLRELCAQELVPGDADDLIRSTDFPKKPSYLPRPYQPQEDRALQERLEASDDNIHKGLLLMRKEGLRLSELRYLDQDCLREDNLGNHFLKVPLGKLHNERLVPLDSKGVDLVKHLQRVAGTANRKYLIETRPGKPTCNWRYQTAIKQIADGIGIAGPIVTHRLRHTFATSLLDGGMSMVGIMRLLGHRDIRMTLQYTAVTQETVKREYFEALTRLQDRYIDSQDQQRTDPDPVQMLNDVIRWLHRKTENSRYAARRAVKLLIRRLERARGEVEELKLWPL